MWELLGELAEEYPMRCSIFPGYRESHNVRNLAIIYITGQLTGICRILNRDNRPSERISIGLYSEVLFSWQLGEIPSQFVIEIEAEAVLSKDKLKEIAIKLLLFHEEMYYINRPN